jgi:hypothetical protein
VLRPRDFVVCVVMGSFPGPRAALRSPPRPPGFGGFADRGVRPRPLPRPHREHRTDPNDRLVSLADPDARPIRKGKLGKPNEFGYVTQLAEVTENTKRGARGLIVPAATAAGNPGEDALLPDTVTELGRLGISPREIALDGGFNVGPTSQALSDLAPERVFISEPGSRRTQRRMQRYRTGAEGRISHLKRRYGMDRSRLKGDEGQQIWTGWSILASNAARSPSEPAETLNELSPRATTHYERPRHLTRRGRFVSVKSFSAASN